MVVVQIDEAAVFKHCQLLQKEERKLNPSMHIVSELMRKTFNARMKFIQTIDTATGQPPTLDTLLKIYPSIRRCDQVSSTLIKLEVNCLGMPVRITLA